MIKTRTFLLTPLAWASVAALAQTLPTGGSISQGNGSLAVNGGTLTVKQTSDRMVADWQSFSIGAGNTVRFVQPSRSSVALNRVLGSDPSRIFGQLTANGQVILQNAAGVYFAPGAQVDVGGLIATSLNADARQFMAGHLSLAGGDAGVGSVRNAGDIHAAPGGHVVLAAPQVANSGRIDTPGGTSALIAGSAVSIDPTGSGLLNISVPVAALNASLRNSGRIRADGGVVSLQAAATDAALRTVMQVGGVVRARSIEQRDGQILLSGGPSGVVAVNGSLDASGRGGEHGGTVEVLGERVALVGHARIDVSGDTGGGSAHVGGHFQGRSVQGQGGGQNAIETVVGRHAVIDASARRQGDGGEVVVWADGNTRYTGRITATGGAQGGDGGQVEVSGKQRLDFDGQVDLRAARGQRGTLLLDPATLDIGTVSNVNGDGTADDDLPDNDLLFADFAGADSQITAARVAQLLATGNVNLEATVSMTVSAPITVAAGGATSTLTLNSPLLDINAALTLRNSSLNADTNQDFNDGILVTAPISSLGTIALTSSNIFLDDASLTAPNVTLTSRGSSGASIGQTGVSGIVTTNLVIDNIAGVPSTVTLDSTLNQAATLSVSASSATLVFTNPAGQRLQVRGDADTLDLGSNNGLTQAAGAGGALTVSDNFTLTTTATGAVAGAVTLNNPANSFGGGVVFDVGSSLELRASGALAAAGTAGREITLAAGGPFSLNGSISSLGTGGASDIDISANGVNLAGSVFLSVPPGGRLLIRSTDWLNDDLGALSFGGGAGQINHVLYGGWGGAEPTTGNVYVTDRTGTVTVPGTDAPPITRVYDGSTAFDYTQTGTSGFASVDNGDGGLTGLDSLAGYTATSTGTFLNKDAGINKGYTVADSNDVVATGLSGALYYGLTYSGFTRPAGVLGSGDPGNAVSVVTPRAITSTGFTGVNRVYDGGTAVGLNAGAATLVGVVATDTVTLATGGAVGAVANKNVANNKAVTITGLTLAGADAANYTVSDASGATVNISPLAITASGYAAVDRVYNGGTAVGLTGSATLAGVLGSDVVSVAGTAAGTMADKNAGTARPVTITGLTLAGADAGNYSVSDASGATVDIAQAALTSTGLTAVNRVYNGLTSVAMNLTGASLAGVVSGDVVGVSTATGTMADKNAGNGKAVTVTNLTLSGADALNYSVTDASGATVDIARAALTSAGLTGVNRVYDGSTSVALNGSAATLTGVLSGDVVSVSGGVGSMADKNVGSGKAVTVGSVTLAGADAGNYVATDSSSPTVTIIPATVFATGLTGVDRVYDGSVDVALDTSAATLSGVIAGDVLGLAASGATGTMADKNVGQNKVVTVTGASLTGADAVNYQLVTGSTPPTVDISALALTASGISALPRVVDGTTVVTLNTSGATLPGVLAGDVVLLDASGASGSVASPEAGVAKPVTVSGLQLSGSDAGNYAILPTVTSPTGAPLTVRLLTVAQQAFEDVRYKEYLQGVSDAQEPFRRAMVEALASGFGKENIRKQLSRGLVFETGLAAPAVDRIESPTRPASCTASGAGLSCAP